MCWKFVFLFLCWVTINESAMNRKYDLNEESRALFGSNLTDVLNNFRRTPEYVDILLERSNDLQAMINDMIDRNAEFYSNMLSAEISEKIKKDFESNPALFRARIRRPQVERRQNDNPDTSAEAADPEAVAAMDAMYGQPPVMKAGEKNEWRDYAFDFLPRFIESLIEPLHTSGDRPSKSQSAAQAETPAMRPQETTTTAAGDDEDATVDNVTAMKEDCNAMKRQGGGTTTPESKKTKTPKNEIILY